MGLRVRDKADFVAVIVENQFNIMTLKYQNSNAPEHLPFCTTDTTDGKFLEETKHRKDVLRHSD